MNMKHLFTFILATIVSSVSALACTSVIITSKASKDGRPMIFKNRDTGSLSNICIERQGTLYRYVGIANARDTIPQEIWGGHNEKGFAIINTADYNLNEKNEKEELEGEIMRIALGECATLADFEKFLDQRERPLCVNTNYGVIDAHGGCAYYEVGNNGYVKYDANDPSAAPEGYLLRTNYGFSGDQTKNQGCERYLAIAEFMKKAQKDDNIDATYLITHIPRYVTHGLTHINLLDYMPETEKDTTMMPFRDYIPRHSTASCLLVQGVRTNEPAAFTTSWLYVGYPLTTVCMPVILNPENRLPQTFISREDGTAWMAEKGLELKKRLFPYTVSNGKDYINVAQLYNKCGTGIQQKLQPVEAKIIRKALDTINDMRKKGKITPTLYDFYDWADNYIRQHFSTL